MKKLVFLPMIAVAALGLTACKKDAPVIDNTVVANDVTLNETVLDENASAPAIDDATANAAIDNATIVDNATGESNLTAK